MKIRVAIGQLKPHKADVKANLQAIGDLFTQIKEENLEVDVLVFPETFLSGYFLEGGVAEVARSRESLFEDLQAEYLQRVGEEAPPLDIVLGFYEIYEGAHYNAYLYATLAGPEQGIRHVHHKVFLPTYGVFDEERFVARGNRFEVFPTRWGKAGLLICEDAWHSLAPTIEALQGAEVIFVGSASPGRGFEGTEVTSVSRWKQILSGIAHEHGVFVVYAGLVGFEGGKGMSGNSMVLSPTGAIIAEAPILQECLLFCTLDLEDIPVARFNSPILPDLKSVLPDLVLQLEEILEGRTRRNPGQKLSGGRTFGWAG